MASRPAQASGRLNNHRVNLKPFLRTALVGGMKRTLIDARLPDAKLTETTEPPPQQGFRKG
jgi:hypothetical protein